MKKLEKLVLKDLPKISIGDQKSILGGSGPDGWNLMLAPDDVWYAYPGGEVYVYGSAPGYITDINSIEAARETSLDNESEFQTGAYICSALGIFTGSKIALSAGLSLQIQANNNEGYADDYQAALYALESKGYSNDSTVRYSNSNGVIKIWDSETGTLIYSSDGN
jgi:hypothetical protein